MKDKSEQKATFCSSCGYPDYAGHGSQCVDVSKAPEKSQFLKATEKPPHGWDTSDIAERSLDIYVELTGFPMEELKGKKVLDIGSSSTQKFAHEAAKHNITVVSLSPDLRMENYRKILENYKNNKGKMDQLRRKTRGHKWKKLAVAAVAEHLPFQDNSFDAEVGLMSITNYWLTIEHYKEGFTEIIRTLKPGGKAYLYPITSEFYFSEDFHKMLDSFSDSANIRIESLKNEAKEREDLKLNYKDDYTPTEEDLYVEKRLIIEKKKVEVR